MTNDRYRVYGSIHHYELTFTGFLKSEHRRRLETEICLEVLSDLTNQSLEGELPNQELS